MHVLFRLQAGGMEHGVIKLANRHDPRRVVAAICSTTPATAVKDGLLPHVPLFELNRRDGNDPALPFRLVQLFVRERPDVVHTHSWGTLIEGWLAARLARVPLLVHGEHGTLDTRPLNLKLQRVWWGRADRLLSVSSRLAERMSSLTGIPMDRITTIRNGVDLARFGRTTRAEARAALGLDPGAILVGTIGRLVPVKDHATLVRALAAMRQRGLDCHVVIAGDGPLRADTEHLAGELGVADRLHLVGYRPDVERVFAALDVFTLPSRSEGLSNTILEAMASGLPIVATRVGGADELVEDGVSGLLVPPVSPEPLADALGALVADTPRRAQMGAAARERAERAFDQLKMVTAYEDLYHDGLTGRGLDGWSGWPEARR